LHWRSPPPHEPIRRNVRSTGGTNRVCEQCRLIVTTPEQTGPMQRYRNKEIRAGENFVAGTVHPKSERPGNVGAITVLETEDKAATAFVVTQHGTRLIPGGPLAGAVAA
jgi:hypothetical protein